MKEDERDLMSAEDAAERRKKIPRISVDSGQMHVTVTLKKSIAGTELNVVQEGIPAAIPVDFCYQGWQESLEMLAKLVEPEIPDGA